MSDALSPNIVLTGFMGTGKTAVGRRIATLTGRTFVDLDAEIVNKHGDINKMFELDGPERFRQVEREVLSEFAVKRNQVIATGGGTLLDPDNVVTLLGSEVYTLTADPEEIHQRILADGIASRPLLANAEDVPATIKTLLAERSEAYGKFPAVDTTGRSVEGVVDALREAGASIETQEAMDPEAVKNRTNQILYAVIAVIAAIALVLFVLVLTF